MGLEVACDWRRSCSWSCSFRLSTYFQINAPITSTARPPIAPPTIAPVLWAVFFAEDDTGDVRFDEIAEKVALGVALVPVSLAAFFVEDNAGDVGLDGIFDKEALVVVTLRAGLRCVADPLTTTSPRSIAQHESASVPFPQQ